MRHRHENTTGRNNKTVNRAIAFIPGFIKTRQALFFLLLGLLIGALCSFTIIKTEDEPTEQHAFGDTISLVKHSAETEEQYAIKILRYFELFPQMRAYLYRFQHTDIKKVCESEPKLLNELIIQPEIQQGFIIIKPRNNSDAEIRCQVAPGIFIQKGS